MRPKRLHWGSFALGCLCGPALYLLGVLAAFGGGVRFFRDK